MSLGQLFLGCITLIVATVVYRWQKMLDRQAQANEELRVLATRYAVLVHTLHLKQPYTDQELNEELFSEFYGISDREIELYTIRDQIYVLAPWGIVTAVLECDRAFRDWKISFPAPNEEDSAKVEECRAADSHFRKTHNEMLVTLRNEFQELDTLKYLKLVKELFSRFTKGFIKPD